jgi:O-antigen/teichoic acid export membrane protein
MRSFPEANDPMPGSQESLLSSPEARGRAGKAAPPAVSVSAGKSLLSYTVSSTALMVATVLSNTIVIRWVPPQEMGIWATVTLIESYLSFLQGGVFSGLNREYPYHVGKNELHYARRLAAVALTYALCCGILVGISFGICLIILGTDHFWRWAITAIGIGSTILFYQQYLQVTFRTSQDFLVLARIQLFQAGLMLISIPLVWHLRFEGLCLRILIINCVATAALHIWRPIRVTPVVDWPALKALFITGVPIMASSYASVVSAGFSRIILLGQGGVAVVGLFTPALAITNAMQSLPGTINSFISPRLSVHYGKNHCPRALWGAAWKAAVGVSGILAVLSVLGWGLLPLLFVKLFPTYLEGVAAARLMMVSGAFLGIQAGIAVLISMKSWLWLGVYSAVLVLTRWFIPLSFAGGAGTELMQEVAAGWILANAIIFVAGLAIVYLATRRERTPGG